MDHLGRGHADIELEVTPNGISNHNSFKKQFNAETMANL